VEKLLSVVLKVFQNYITETLDDETTYDTWITLK
jgi:hypothetical protein